MSLTASTILPLGTQAPDFRLKDVVSNRMMSLKDFDDYKALLVMFICQHCPYVQHVKGELAKLPIDYKWKSLGIAAICSNDAKTYPDDSPEGLRKFAETE